MLFRSLLYTIAVLNNGATSNAMVSGSASFYASGTDYFEVYLYQDSGGSLTTIALTDAVRIEGELIGY